MRQSIIVVVAATLGMLAATAAAQPVRVRLHVPPPNQTNIENLWWVDLNNTTQNTYTARLRGEVSEAQQGLVYRASTDSFTIPPGPKRVTLRNMTIRDQWAKPGYQAFITRTGLLPEGDYSYKVWLEPDLGGDSGTSKVRHPTPPRLQFPRDGDAVPSPTPNLTWIGQRGYPGPVSYELVMVEIMPGQSKEEALRANRPWFSKRSIAGGALRYPLAARKLETGRRYAWQVRSYVGGRYDPSLSSEVWEFSVGGGWHGGLEPVIPLKVERTVTRHGNWFAVSLSLTNAGSDSIWRFVITDTNIALQSTGTATVTTRIGQFAYTRTETLNLDNSRQETDTQVVSLVLSALKPGVTRTVTYHVVPVLCFRAGVVKQRWVTGRGGLAASYRYKDKYHKHRYRDEDSIVDGAAAVRDADYVLATHCWNLFRQHGFAADSVCWLFGRMAALAKARDGVLAYFGPSAQAGEYYRNAISDHMAPMLRPGYNENGYLLIIGEDWIFPSWDAALSTGEIVVQSDYPYSDWDDDLYPELRVGRIAGKSPTALAVPLETSIRSARGEFSAAMDRVFFGSGDENTWADGYRGMIFAADMVQARWRLKQLGAGSNNTILHRDFVTSRRHALIEALKQIAVARGGANSEREESEFSYLTEEQLAAWLIAVGTPLSLPARTDDLTFTDTEGRTRRIPKDFGASGVQSALGVGGELDRDRHYRFHRDYAAGFSERIYAYSLKGKFPNPTAWQYDYFDTGDEANNAFFQKLKVAVAEAGVVLGVGHSNEYYSMGLIHHGNVDDLGMNLWSRRPIVIAYGCHSGAYRGIQSGGSVRQFLLNGAACYIGSTENMYGPGLDHVMRDILPGALASSSTVGEMMNALKWEGAVCTAADPGDVGYRREQLQFNLYGDPKYPLK